jgi:hypothetical protein
MSKQKLFPALVLLGLTFTALLVSQSINEAQAAAAPFPLGQWTFESTTDRRLYSGGWDMVRHHLWKGFRSLVYEGQKHSSPRKLRGVSQRRWRQRFF